MKSTIGVFWTVCLAGAIVAAAQTGSMRIRIGLLPERNVFDQVARYEALAAHLSAELKPSFELTVLTRYGNVVQRIARSDIQAAFLGSFTGALAANQLDMVPVARPVNRDGTSTYFGQIFVRSDSGIETVADMKGKRLALVEKATMAGYVFPRAYLQAQGVEDFEAYFSEVRFWGSHDATVISVLEGRADVGAAKNTVMDWQAGQDSRVTEELRIVASSEQVPSNALFLSSFLGRDLREEIREVLLGLDQTPKGRRVLERLEAVRFVATERDDYAPLFDLAAEAGIDLRNYDYQNQ